MTIIFSILFPKCIILFCLNEIRRRRTNFILFPLEWNKKCTCTSWSWLPHLPQVKLVLSVIFIFLTLTCKNTRHCSLLLSMLHLIIYTGKNHLVFILLRNLTCVSDMHLKIVTYRNKYRITKWLYLCVLTIQIYGNKIK